MSIDSPRHNDYCFKSLWRNFGDWRGSRPFCAGLLTMLAGVPILYLPYAGLSIGQITIRMATTAGSGSLVIGVLLMTIGLTMWFQPIVRVFAGVAAIVLALLSIPMSNLGGFLVGLLLALLGAALAIAWAPGEPRPGHPSTWLGPARPTSLCPATDPTTAARTINTAVGDEPDTGQ